MSLKNLMDHAQAQGRNGDSMLVHMTPKEVHSLQGLAQAHGGTLTVNPETGLPEANFLESILPAVAGIGLSVMSGGTLTPLMAAMITGAGTGLVTGSMEKGLMAGLGAFGGAGLAGGLAGAGASAAGNAALSGVNAASAAGAGATSGLAGLGQAGGAELASTLGTQALANPAMSAAVTPGLAGVGQVGGANMASGLAQQGAMANPTMSAAFPQGAGGIGDAASAYANQMGQGIQSLGQNPGGIADIMGGPMGMAKTAGMLALPLLAGQQEQEGVPEADPGMIRPYTFNQTRNENRQPGERYFNSSYTAGTPQAPADFKGYAEGGLAEPIEGGDPAVPSIAGLAALDGPQITAFNQTRLAEPDASGRKFEQSYSQRAMTDVDRSNGLVATTGSSAYGGAINPRFNPDDPFYSTRNPFDTDGSGEVEGMEAFNAYVQSKFAGTPGDYGSEAMMKLNNGYRGYAEGGIASMGRHLKGDGDGLSDSIPAVIDGKQPAALATDEFVVPADVVSQLGNGSSDAGAKQLHAMMDRIRSKAHGTKKQQRRVDAAKVLPV